MKKQIISAILSLILLPYLLQGQNDYIAHQDMRKIANSSSVGYEFNQLEYVFVYENLPIVGQGLVITKDGLSDKLVEYRQLETYEVKLLKADSERLFQEGKFAKARKLYTKVLDNMPKHSEAMTYIGYTYQLEQDNKSAKKWYIKAIEANHINYVAHAALADVLLKEGKAKEALNSILRAHILNRNDEQLLKSVQKICQYNGLAYTDWVFTPQFELIAGESGSIKIDYHGTPWKYYGLCQAFWAYEPAYKETDAKPLASAFDLRLERDCMKYAISSYDQIVDGIKTQIYPEFVAYKKAIKLRVAPEYLLYEIKLQEDPILGSLLTLDELEMVVHYIKNIRLKTGAAIMKI